MSDSESASSTDAEVDTENRNSRNEVKEEAMSALVVLPNDTSSGDEQDHGSKWTCSFPNCELQFSSNLACQAHKRSHFMMLKCRLCKKEVKNQKKAHEHFSKRHSFIEKFRRGQYWEEIFYEDPTLMMKKVKVNAVTGDSYQAILDSVLNDELKQKVVQLEADTKSIGKLNKELEEKVATVENDIKEKDAQIQGLEEKVVTVENDIKEKDAKIQGLENELETQKAKVKELTGEIIEFKTRCYRFELKLKASKDGLLPEND